MNRLSGFFIGAAAGTALCGAFFIANRAHSSAPRPLTVRVSMACENTAERFGIFLYRQPGQDTLQLFQATPRAATQPLEPVQTLSGEMSIDQAAREVGKFCAGADYDARKTATRPEPVF